MKIKRIGAGLLALVLTCTAMLSPAPASASFSDITDPADTVNADVLHLMGVANGVGDNRFMPDNTLTRAEFCVMVTNFIQRGEEVTRYASRTIFRDVSGSHWARGYINLMATPAGEEPAMISGIGDGSFAPGQTVTTAQAVTVLLRVLGYTDAETGSVWPHGHMDLARSIGLLEGLPQQAGAPLTRAQVARLFVNALGSPIKGGKDYYTTMGTVQENVILLSVGVTTDDNTSRYGIRTSDGEVYLAAAGEVSPTALQGKRGALVLNDRNEIVTFLPDDSNCISLTLSGNAQPSYLTGTDGNRYTMSDGTMLYTQADGDGKKYIEGYTSLRSGAHVTLFSDSGKITAVYAPGSTADPSQGAVVVPDRGADYALFHPLTGGAENCGIVKNGQPISMDEIQPYDVVTYDRLNNTLLVSDLRLQGIYEDASPNPKAPTVIRALGTDFTVLDSAWDHMDGVELGDNICLLLTADGLVAGVRRPAAGCRANAVGMVSGNTVTIKLDNGEELSLSGTVSNERAQGQLVEVSSSSKGKLSVRLLDSSSGSASLNLNTMMLGDTPVSTGVRLYDRVGSSVMSEIQSADLGTRIISGDQIAYIHKNTSGYIDYLVFENVTGNVYHYGMCKRTVEGGEPAVDENGEEYLTPETQFLTLENGLENGITGLKTPYSFKANQFAAVALNAEGKVRSLYELEEIEGVSPADFFESRGKTFVNVKGRVYPVSDDVVCYKTQTGSWFTQETGPSRLAACKAFSDDLTLWADPFVGAIRIICAE